MTQCNYEAKSGTIVGTRVKGVSKENALEAVRGYVCANDVTARELQFSDGQWSRSKSVNTLHPGELPLIPAAEEVPDPHALAIRTIVSGEVLQDSTTANLIFGVNEIISHIARTITLEPGDLILTGTPAGVGVFRRPRRLLEPGDEVTIEIEGLGFADQSRRRSLSCLRQALVRADRVPLLGWLPLAPEARELLDVVLAERAVDAEVEEARDLHARGGRRARVPRLADDPRGRAGRRPAGAGAAACAGVPGVPLPDGRPSPVPSRQQLEEALP